MLEGRCGKLASYSAEQSIRRLPLEVVDSSEMRCPAKGSRGRWLCSSLAGRCEACAECSPTGRCGPRPGTCQRRTGMLEMMNTARQL